MTAAAFAALATTLLVATAAVVALTGCLVVACARVTVLAPVLRASEAPCVLLPSIMLCFAMSQPDTFRGIIPAYTKIMMTQRKIFLYIKSCLHFGVLRAVWSLNTAHICFPPHGSVM